MEYDNTRLERLKALNTALDAVKKAASDACNIIGSSFEDEELRDAISSSVDALKKHVDDRAKTILLRQWRNA